MKKSLLLLLLNLMVFWAHAQQATYINGVFNINVGTPVTWYGDVTFGPEAIVYMEDGATAIFYGKNMVVDPGATFIALPSNGQIGTGAIVFKDNNPNYSNYPLQQTLNGGYTSGNNPTLLNIEIDNAQGLSLLGNTRVANLVKFTKGHIYLNNYNLVLGPSASLNNYSVVQHVVTNGTGVLTKENIGNNNVFSFPVSVAGADYTAATVTNQSGLRSISVQVKDYTTSAAVENTFVTKGMDRTWQITSNVAGAVSIALQHNAANNANGTGTNESGFDNALAYVSQQISPGVWSESCTGTNGGSPVSINFGSFTLPTNVSATAFFTKRTVTCTDLMVTKSVNNAAPIVGNNLTFTIVVKNNSTVDATGVLVNDQLPSGYAFVGTTATNGTYNNTTGIWNIGNLAAGATVTLTVTATVNATGTYANKATVLGNETDPDLANNESTVVPTPGSVQANLGVEKTVDNISPTIGNNVVFTVTASNFGPNNATNVKVTDVLPAGYTYVGTAISTGTFDQPTGIWTLGNLANGVSATMIITAKVNAVGPYANTAVITGTELDPVSANNSSTVSPVPNANMVDLSITKAAATKPGIIGEEIEYTFEVKNTSANLATGIVATDVLPSGLNYMSSITNYGTASYNASTRTLSWNIGSLAAGATISLALKVKTAVDGIIVNTATVNSSEQDFNMDSNISTASKEIFDIRMPNVITPDGDGQNDVLKFPGLKAYPENTITIFNRWGNEVWRSKGSYQEDWNGEGLNEGTYYFILRLKDQSGKWQNFTKWITLLR